MIIRPIRQKKEKKNLFEYDLFSRTEK